MFVLQASWSSAWDSETLVSFATTLHTPTRAINTRAHTCHTHISTRKGAHARTNIPLCSYAHVLAKCSHFAKHPLLSGAHFQRPTHRAWIPSPTVQWCTYIALHCIASHRIALRCKDCIHHHTLTIPKQASRKDKHLSHHLLTFAKSFRSALLFRARLYSERRKMAKTKLSVRTASSRAISMHSWSLRRPLATC